jgi:hypothetical protein
MEVEEFALRRPTLDDVFFALTGRGAMDVETSAERHAGGRTVP